MHQESHSLGYLAPLVITYKTIIVIVPQKYCQFIPTYDLSGNMIKKNTNNENCMIYKSTYKLYISKVLTQSTNWLLSKHIIRKYTMNYK